MDFTPCIGGSRPQEARWAAGGAAGFVKEAHCCKNCGTLGTSPYQISLCKPYRMCCWWDTTPWGFLKMIADFFFFCCCKSHACNNHLSVWRVGMESHWAALQEVQGGSSYLTCSRYAIIDWELPLLYKGALFLTINAKKDDSYGQSRSCLCLHILLVSLGWLFAKSVVHLFTDNLDDLRPSESCYTVNTALSSWQFALTGGARMGPFYQSVRQLVFFNFYATCQRCILEQTLV